MQQYYVWYFDQSSFYISEETEEIKSDQKVDNICQTSSPMFFQLPWFSPASHVQRTGSSHTELPT